MFASRVRITKPSGLAKDQMTFGAAVADQAGIPRQLNDLPRVVIGERTSSVTRWCNPGIRLGHSASR